MSDRGYRGLVDSFASGELQAHGFLAAVESRVDASLPPAAAMLGRDNNLVHFSSWRASRPSSRS